MKIEYYDLYFEFKDENFTGIEKVYIETEKDVEFDCNVKVNEIKSYEGKRLDFEQLGDKIIVHTGKFSGWLLIEFEGKVSKESLVGIYKAKDMVTTQFEPNFANRLFPCIDNPSYKAVFKLSVCVEKGFNVISNMPIDNIQEKDEKIIYNFKPTPPMSTYLLYLGIGKFEEIKENGVIVATLQGKISKGNFALKVAQDCLNFYSNYFNMPYMLPKLHLITVPDFLAGAMENWGAITFRESSLLADESSSLENKKDVIITISHEIAHQWFGNLVTLKWWDDLWLNESFATFLSFKCAESIYPKYNFLGDFIISGFRALFLDSLSSTHKIKAEIRTPVEINEAFDEISYEKGASVLRMLEHYIGEEVFRKGIISYLNKFKYSNATAKDFFDSFKAEFIEDWILKPGYPVISLDINKNKVHISQERFSLLKNTEEILYRIPFTLEINGKKLTKIINSKSEEIVLNEEVKAVKANLNRSGFYRVFYSDLKFVKNLNDFENAGFIDDYYNFLIVRKIRLNEFTRLIKEREKYKGLTTSETISRILSNLFKISPEKYRDLAESYIFSQILVWEKDKDEESRSLISRLIRRLCFINEDFASQYHKLIDNYDKLDNEMKDIAVIAYAVKTSDYKTLMKKYEHYAFDEDKERFLNGISAVKDPSVTKEIFSSFSKFKYQHIFSLINWLASNPYIRKEFYNVVLENIEKIKDLTSKIAGGIWGFGIVIRSILPALSLVNRREIEKLLDSLEYKELSRDISNAKEMIEINERLLKAD